MANCHNLSLPLSSLVVRQGNESGVYGKKTKFFSPRGKKERKTSNLFAGLRYNLWISEQNRAGGEILVYYDTFIPLGFVKVARFS
jgi:hypothetical protein